MSTTITPTEQNIDINVTEDVIDINVTNNIVDVNATAQQINIEVSGAYPIPNPVLSVFGRTGAVVATEGDYSLTQLSDVTLSSPANGQVLKYNGTIWVNSSDADTGITTLNTLTALTQTFAVGTSGTDFAISSATSTHTFNLPTASATNRGALSSADWTTFSGKQSAITLTTTGTSGAATFSAGTLNIPQYQGVLTNPVTGTGTTNTLPKFTAASTIGNSNITDTGSLITLGSNSTVIGDFTVSKNDRANGSLLTLTNLFNGTGWIAGDVIGTLNFTSIDQSLTEPIRARIQALSSTVGNRPASINLAFTTANDDILTEGFRLTNLSNLLIGTTTDSGFRLDVNGTARVQGNFTTTGSVGIGTTSLTGYNLRVAKNLTGATVAYGIAQTGSVQSDVTSVLYNFYSQINTAAASFTLGDYVHFMADNSISLGAGSSVTRQYGFLAQSSLTSAGTNYGFFGAIPSGTNRWNLYMNGTANNYLAGSLGIGTTSFVSGGGTYNLNLAKSITGTVVAGAMNIGGLVQSDVTSAAIGLNVQVTTAAAAFTLSQLRHISINQTTLGVGSSVSNQYGIYIDQITNGTSNFGFFGNVPAGTNRWNLYMNGTAANFLAGRLGLGLTASSTNLATNLNITGGVGANGIYQLGVVQSDVTAQAYGYRNLSATQAASFTLTDYFHYSALQGSFGAGSVVTNQYGFHVDSTLVGATNDFGFYGNLGASANVWNLYMNGTAANYMAGSLGIGSTGLTNITLRLSKTITGSTTSYGIYNSGTVQSDVTGAAWNNISESNTAASAFTLANYYHYGATQGTIGAGSAITTQRGFFVNSNLIGATINYGFQGSIPSGTNRWNLYMDGTANNYLAGSLGIGTTSLTGQHNLRVSRNISGSTIAYGILNEGITQSDVTNFSIMYTSSAQTAAAAFTLNNMVHYYAQQSALGAGSAITNQYGFWAESNLTGATNNYGFYGNIASGTNRWNLYMGGTANNYMAGSLGIGSTSLSLFGLRVSKTITGGTIAYNQFNDGSVQSDVTSEAMYYSTNATTAAAAFTLTNLFHYRCRYNIFGASSAVTNQYGFFVDSTLTAATNNYAFYSSIGSGTNRWNLYMAGTAANYLAGPLNINTTTLSGYALDVNGTAIFRSTPTMSSIQDAGNNFSITRANSGGFVQLIGGNTTTIRADKSVASGGTNSVQLAGDSTIIGATLLTPNASAQLQVDSTTKGFLPPRMTTVQKLAIGTPAAGLMVYDTTLNQMSYYNGTLWINF